MTDMRLPASLDEPSGKYTRIKTGSRERLPTMTGVLPALVSPHERFWDSALVVANLLLDDAVGGHAVQVRGQIVELVAGQRVVAGHEMDDLLDDLIEIDIGLAGADRHAVISMSAA